MYVWVNLHLTVNVSIFNDIISLYVLSSVTNLEENKSRNSK